METMFSHNGKDYLFRYSNHTQELEVYLISGTGAQSPMLRFFADTFDKAKSLAEEWITGKGEPKSS